MGKELLPQFILDNYEVIEHRHACAILKKDFPNEWNDLTRVLTNFKLLKSHITKPGGSRSQIPKVIEDGLNEGKSINYTHLGKLTPRITGGRGWRMPNISFWH